LFQLLLNDKMLRVAQFFDWRHCNQVYQHYTLINTQKLSNLQTFG